MIRDKHHKCFYCDYHTTDLEHLKAHEERLHGCYRDISPRKRKKSTTSKKDASEGNIVNLPDGGVCKWDGHKYVDILPKPKTRINEGEPDKIEMGNGKIKYKCQNCGRYSTFLLDPFTYYSLPQKKRVRYSKDEYPLIPCPSCGFNIFKDNRIKLYKWLIRKKGRKLPKAMSYDVMMSAITDDDRGIIKRGKHNEIL